MNICLYGASSTELDARYLDAAYDLGRRIAAGGHTMVYGGGAQGVMGAAARGVVDGGGALVGIAPPPDGQSRECCQFDPAASVRSETGTALAGRRDTKTGRATRPAPERHVRLALRGTVAGGFPRGFHSTAPAYLVDITEPCRPRQSGRASENRNADSCHPEGNGSASCHSGSQVFA